VRRTLSVRRDGVETDARERDGGDDGAIDGCGASRHARARGGGDEATRRVERERARGEGMVSMRE